VTTCGMRSPLEFDLRASPESYPNEKRKTTQPL
jgi:hypothetical protein